MKFFRYSSVKSNVYISFGVAMLLFIIIGYVFYWSTTKFIESSRWITHTQKVVSDLRIVLSQLVDSETGQRGYLLTSRENYLEPFNNAAEVIELNIKDLRELTSDNNAQQQRIDILESLVAQKMTELKETIDLKREERAEEAIQIVLTDRGKIIMDNIRGVLGEMEMEENELMKDRMDSFLQNNIILQVITYLLIILVFTFVIFSIHRLKQAEEKQTQLLNQLNVIINSVGEALVVTDKDLKITTVNPAFVELIEKNEKEIIGKMYDEIVQCLDEKDEIKRTMNVSIEKTVSKGITTESRSRIKTSDEQIVTIGAIHAPLKSGGGKIIGVVNSIRDISKEAKIDRMKTEFISTVSHELRTPLTSIKGYIDLILDGDTGEINELQKEFLEIVSQSSDRLNNLINDLLDAEKIESGKIAMKFKKISLSNLVNLALSTMESSVEKKGLKLISKIEEGIEMYGDSDRIIQVLINFISNAVKFTKGGEITVELKLINGKSEIVIQDTGIGISKSDQKKLFTKFFRADDEYTRSVGGTGLGLSIVKAIVEKHGGEIKVKSELNKGSEFRVIFPLRKERKIEKISTLEIEQKRDNIPAILIIDDEEDIAHLISENIKKLGYSAVIATSGKEGLRLADELIPDVITLDVLMPDIDGWEVMAHLKANKKTKKIPVVFISVVLDREKGMRLGAAAYLMKPMNSKVLINTIGKLVKEKRKSALIIDDDKDSANLLKRLLQKEGMTVEVADTGNKGLKRVIVSKPEIIILDKSLPDISGLEVLKKLRAEKITENIPVILMSETPSDEDVTEEVKILGADKFLNKKIGIEEMVKEIVTFINK